MKQTKLAILFLGLLIIVGCSSSEDDFIIPEVENSTSYGEYIVYSLKEDSLDENGCYREWVMNKGVVKKELYKKDSTILFERLYNESGSIKNENFYINDTLLGFYKVYKEGKLYPDASDFLYFEKNEDSMIKLTHFKEGPSYGTLYSLDQDYRKTVIRKFDNHNNYFIISRDSLRNDNKQVYLVDMKVKIDSNMVFHSNIYFRSEHINILLNETN